MDDLAFAKESLSSRLLIGTGRFPNMATMRQAIESSGAEVVTVAIRRLPLDSKTGRALEGENILKHLPDGIRILPNTAGCATASEAVKVAQMSRAMGLPPWIKLEVIPDKKYLLPDPIGTLEAARALIADGFQVLPYINDDPVLARRLEEEGCAAVMPLASPIGSGQGMVNFRQIRIIIEGARVPVVVDAGLGAPSDASLAMEIGAAACLVNTGIAMANDPVRMARAFRLGVEAGRHSYLAGRIPKREEAAPSSLPSNMPNLSRPS